MQTNLRPFAKWIQMQMHEIDTGSFTAHMTVQFQNRNEHRNP